MLILELIGAIWLILGILFSLVGMIGVFRFPDVYSQLHASGTVSTLGVICCVIGAAFLHPAWFPRLLILGLFVLLTSPAAGHAIAKAALNAGMRMKDPVRDDYQRDVPHAYESIENAIEKEVD